MMEKYVFINENTASRIIDGQAVIMTLGDNTLHTLNGVASRIWELCDGQKTVTQIINIIHKEYIVAYQEAREDCKLFIQQLCNKGILALGDKAVEKEKVRG